MITVFLHPTREMLSLTPVVVEATMQIMFQLLTLKMELVVLVLKKMSGKSLSTKKLTEHLRLGGNVRPRIEILPELTVPVGPWAKEYSTEIGIIVRKHAPLCCHTWKEVKKHTRYPTLFEQVLKRFDMDFSQPHVVSAVDGHLKNYSRNIVTTCDATTWVFQIMLTKVDSQKMTWPKINGQACVFGGRLRNFRKKVPPTKGAAASSKSYIVGVRRILLDIGRIW